MTVGGGTTEGVSSISTMTGVAVGASIHLWAGESPRFVVRCNRVTPASPWRKEDRGAPNRGAEDPSDSVSMAGPSKYRTGVGVADRGKLSSGYAVGGRSKMLHVWKELWKMPDEEKYPDHVRRGKWLVDLLDVLRHQLENVWRRQILPTCRTRSTRCNLCQIASSWPCSNGIKSFYSKSFARHHRG